MEFVYKGTNEMGEYVYLYEPKRKTLEEVIAKILLKQQKIKITQETLKEQLKFVKDNDLVDDEELMEELFEEIKEELQKEVNADF